ncbi:MAG TPA: presqualene diphosphate synthase HpnD [Casimicrobiaceae bacterium]|nr:presqualene diphosphate synthase HpnD [Casimicrobiaceae bacterium]
MGEAARREGTSLIGSSFYAGMRVLPPAQRRAMFEIYRFCRAVDDIADGRADRDTRLTQLDAWRRDVDALFAGVPPERVQGLLEPLLAFDLERDDFLSVIEGMQMDVATDMVAPDYAMLELYCDRVACAVGRLSVRVFGMQNQEGAALACHLGRALQLTNILRDLDEDAAKGRLYLPREALHAAGIDQTDPAAVLAHPALRVVCGIMVDDARGHFAEARTLMEPQPQHIVRAPRMMALVYEDILERLALRGWAPPRRPVHVGRGRLLWIVLVHEWLGQNRSVKAKD